MILFWKSQRENILKGRATSKSFAKMPKNKEFTKTAN
jgi:hypothetical protein